MHVEIKPEAIAAWVEANFSRVKSRKNGAEYVVDNPLDGDTGMHMNINVVRIIGLAMGQSIY